MIYSSLWSALTSMQRCSKLVETMQFYLKYSYARFVQGFSELENVSLCAFALASPFNGLQWCLGT